MSLNPMILFRLDPTQDTRWTEFIERSDGASIFHTVGWLKALRDTYNYKPIAFTTSAPQETMKNAIVFCEVDSWITGRRLVSLPFSDHCQPLTASASDFGFLLRSLQEEMKAERWRYLEVRPAHVKLDDPEGSTGFAAVRRYYWHLLDLEGDLNRVLGRFDKDSVQRRIHHAERMGLIEKIGTSDEQLKQFYALFVVTRSRHHVPPMPYTWFHNLIQNLGQALQIRLAFMQDKPVAAILTLRFKNVLYYKYGCSDLRFNRLGAMPWLLWRAICDAKLCGANKFDLGRTEDDNAGLLAFKNNWGSPPNQLTYWRYPATLPFDSIASWKLKLAKRVFARMPGSLLTISGRLMYKHIG